MGFPMTLHGLAQISSLEHKAFALFTNMLSFLTIPIVGYTLWISHFISHLLDMTIPFESPTIKHVKSKNLKISS
jgi:hypothetical protein